MHTWCQGLCCFNRLVLRSRHALNTKTSFVMLCNRPSRDTPLVRQRFNHKAVHSPINQPTVKQVVIYENLTNRQTGTDGELTKQPFVICFYSARSPTCNYFDKSNKAPSVTTAQRGQPCVRERPDTGVIHT